MLGLIGQPLVFRGVLGPSQDSNTWLGSPPFISHGKASWKGSHNPILRGRNRSPWLLTTYSSPGARSSKWMAQGGSWSSTRSTKPKHQFTISWSTISGEISWRLLHLEMYPSWNQQQVYPWKLMSWNTILALWVKAYFQGRDVSFRECNYQDLPSNSSWWFATFCMFIPYLGTWSNLTHIVFQNYNFSNYQYFLYRLCRIQRKPVKRYGPHQKPITVQNILDKCDTCRFWRRPHLYIYIHILWIPSFPSWICRRENVGTPARVP